MQNKTITNSTDEISKSLGFEDHSAIDDIATKLDGIESELLLLNEKVEKIHSKEIERLLFFVLIALIYIAIKL